MHASIGFILVLSSTLSVTNGIWSYGYANHLSTPRLDPSDWYKYEPNCKGHAQSPVNIEFGKTKYDGDVKPIEIVKLAADMHGIETWDMLNNGHTVKLTPTNAHFKFTMYPQKEVFNLQQLHFHWRGSEHLVDDKKFAGEIHLVFKSDSNPKQYSVIGYFIDLVSDDNANMQPIVDDLFKVREFNTSISLEGAFRLQDIVPFQIEDFFRYNGSLTTPGCSEVVEWNLVDSPVLGLSETQMLEFQGLMDNKGHSILSNARPIQSLNKRVVLRSFKPFYSALRKQEEAASDFMSEASSRMMSVIRSSSMPLVSKASMGANGSKFNLSFALFFVWKLCIY